MRIRCSFKIVQQQVLLFIKVLLYCEKNKHVFESSCVNYETESPASYRKLTLPEGLNSAHDISLSRKKI